MTSVRPRSSTYVPRLYCLVSEPVMSSVCPATAPATSARHFADLQAYRGERYRVRAG